MEEVYSSEYLLTHDIQKKNFTDKTRAKTFKDSLKKRGYKVSIKKNGSKITVEGIKELSINEVLLKEKEVDMR